MKKVKQGTKLYGRLIVLLAAVFLLLAACAGPSSEVPPGPEETAVALFTDSDIDGAVPEVAESTEELVGTDEGDAPEGEELDLPGSEDALTTQAVLPGASGFIAYIRHDPSSATPWQLWQANQVTDAKTQVYAGAREIDSVAVTSDGKTFVVAMKRSTSSSDFEVYRLTLGSTSLTRLTVTDTPEKNVSMSADGSTLAWIGVNAATGKRTVFMRVYSGASFTDTILSSTVNQVEASVSGDGNFIALVRQLSGKNQVMRYSRTANSYLTVASSDVTIARFRHPSPSNGGTKVAWLEVRSTGQQVRVKTISSGATANVVSAASIEHPHLTADGNFLTYGLLQNNSWRVLTRNLSTAQVATAVSSASPVNNYAPYWQQPSGPSTFSISGTIFGLTGAVVIPFSSTAGGPATEVEGAASHALSDSASEHLEQTITPPKVEILGRHTGQEFTGWSGAVPGLDYVEGEVLVGFKQDTFSIRTQTVTPLSVAQADALNVELKAVAATLAQSYGYQVVSTSPVISMARLRLPAGTSVLAAMQRLKNDPRVAYVEPNGLMYGDITEPVPAQNSGVSPELVETMATVPTNDPLFSQQKWHYSLVGAQRGWDTQQGSSSVRVAVLDTGYRPDHPDRPLVIRDEYDFVAFNPNGSVASGDYYPICNSTSRIPRAWDLNGYDNNATEWMEYDWGEVNGVRCATNPSPSGSHGTHVTGTIAAQWNNGGGVGLIDYVSIIPIQVLDVLGRGTWYDIAQGVLYAGGLPAPNGRGGTVQIPRADIANMSLGGTSPSSTLQNAVTRASNNGLLIIAGAGNNDSSIQFYPAAYPEVVAVTAIGPNGTKAYYSNFGSWVELTAPGGDFSAGVLSTTYNYAGCSTTPGNLCNTSNGGVANYAQYQGTSMAAPHVSGVAALYKMANLDLTRAQLRQKLRDLAFDWGASGFDNYFGYGLVHIRPGFGVPLVASNRTARVYLINSTTGALVATQDTAWNSDAYSFTNVPNGNYYVLAAVKSAFSSFGTTGAAIGAYGSFQNPMPVAIAGTNLTGIDVTVGWPGFESSNGPATPGFMYPGFYAGITYSSNGHVSWFKVIVPTAGTYRIWTDGHNDPDGCGYVARSTTGFGDFDTVIELYENGLRAWNDNADSRGHCSEITLSLSPGTYYVRVWASVDDPVLVGRKTILRFDAQ